MDICHAAGPISPIVSVSLQGLCIETLYMPSNTDLSPLLWPPSLTPLKSQSTPRHQPLVMAEGKCNPACVPLLWLGVVWTVVVWTCQSQTMNGTDAGFMAPKCDRWWTTLPAITHGTCPVMLMCSENILRALLIRISQADLKLQPVQFIS